jgi:hypothetical protein
MESRIVAPWLTCNQITLKLLARIPEAALADRYAPRTRTVAAQFAHIHYVRVRNLQQRGPAFLDGLESFPTGAQPAKGDLVAARASSGQAVAELLGRCEATGSVKSWSGPPSSYLGYLVSHEAHHRALAIVALRLGGHKMPQSVTHDIWYMWRKP